MGSDADGYRKELNAVEKERKQMMKTIGRRRNCQDSFDSTCGGAEDSEMITSVSSLTCSALHPKWYEGYGLRSQDVWLCPGSEAEGSLINGSSLSS